MTDPIYASNALDLKKYIRSIAAYKPPMNLVEWADNHAMLVSEVAGVDRKLDLSDTPYNRKILECLSDDHPCDIVAFMKAVRVAGSENGRVMLAAHVDQGRGLFLWALPKGELCSKFSVLELDPLLRKTKKIQDKLVFSNVRDKKASVYKKTFRNGAINIIPANPASFSQVSGQKGVFDECDAVEFNVTNLEEGDLAELFMDRFNAAGESRKMFFVSSPRNMATSIIHPLYMSGDQNRYHIPCPLCTHPQELSFDRLVWPDMYKENSKPHLIEYICIKCDRGFEEKRYKRQFLNDGEWIPKNPSDSERVVSFHLNALYSPLGWNTWERIASKLEKAEFEDDELLRIKNTQTLEAIPYRPKSNKPGWESLKDRKENYSSGTVPAGVIYLVAASDVNEQFIALTVYGVTRVRKEGFIIEYAEWNYDLAKPEVCYEKWLSFLNKTYQVEQTDKVLAIKILGIDRKYQTEFVDTFCRLYPERTVQIRGTEKSDFILSSPISADGYMQGKKKANYSIVREVGDNFIKPYIYSCLQKKINNDGTYPPGFIHFNKDLGEKYFRQLVSETYVETVNKYGHISGKWKKSGRNEPFDTLIYCIALLETFGYSHLSEEDFDARTIELYPNGFTRDVIPLFVPEFDLKQKESIEATIKEAAPSSSFSYKVRPRKPANYRIEIDEYRG